jgi:hypothetical protein
VNEFEEKGSHDRYALGRLRKEHEANGLETVAPGNFHCLRVEGEEASISSSSAEAVARGKPRGGNSFQRLMETDPYSGPDGLDGG